MSDPDWEARRSRAVMAAMQTGRPVFVGADGIMRFGDGAQEPVGDELGYIGKWVPIAATVRPSWWTRLKKMWQR